MSFRLRALKRALPLRSIRRPLGALTAVVLAGTGLIGLAGPASAGPAATHPFLYVANGISNSVTAYDLTANTTAATIPAGTQPQGVAVSPDGRTVYIASA